MKLDEGNILCEVCGKRIEDYNTRKYCKECAREKQLQWQRESMKKLRSKKCYGNRKSFLAIDMTRFIALTSRFLMWKSNRTD